jgi:hypothetical protein
MKRSSVGQVNRDGIEQIFHLNGNVSFGITCTLSLVERAFSRMPLLLLSSPSSLLAWPR